MFHWLCVGQLDFVLNKMCHLWHIWEDLLVLSEYISRICVCCSVLNYGCIITLLTVYFCFRLYRGSVSASLIATAVHFVAFVSFHSEKYNTPHALSNVKQRGRGARLDNWDSVTSRQTTAGSDVKRAGRVDFFHGRISWIIGQAPETSNLPVRCVLCNTASHPQSTCSLFQLSAGPAIRRRQPCGLHLDVGSRHNQHACGRERGMGDN